LAMRETLCSLLIVGGTASLGVGLWWLAPWIALVVLGALALAVGAAGSLRGDHRE